MKPRVLFISNGHGEDVVAGVILDRLSREKLEISAWPLVGRGEAYRSRGIPLTGEPNLLPSRGFATLSARLLWADLRAGWLATHWRQVRCSRRLRDRFDLGVAVGDIVPVLAARLAGLPLLFVGCANSAYYGRAGRYNAAEKRLLARWCRVAFPRDALTAAALARAGVTVRYVGNPMMDDLEPSGDDFGIPRGTPVVGMLPGSRDDAGANILVLLAVARAAAREKRTMTFLVAPPGSLSLESTLAALGAGAAPGWRQAVNSGAAADALHLVGENGATALIVRGRFVDALHRSDIVVGLAGTANEQAVGLGKPLVTFPTAGVQGPAYVRMKMKYFGPAAVAVRADPGAAARAVLDLLADPERGRRMSAAGRERMGQPGASAAIASAILAAAEELVR